MAESVEKIEQKIKELQQKKREATKKEKERKAKAELEELRAMKIEHEALKIKDADDEQKLKNYEAIMEQARLLGLTPQTLYEQLKELVSNNNQQQNN